LLAQIVALLACQVHFAYLIASQAVRFALSLTAHFYLYQTRRVYLADLVIVRPGFHLLEIRFFHHRFAADLARG